MGRTFSGRRAAQGDAESATSSCFFPEVSPSPHVLGGSHLQRISMRSYALHAYSTSDSTGCGSTDILVRRINESCVKLALCISKLRNFDNGCVCRLQYSYGYLLYSLLVYMLSIDGLIIVYLWSNANPPK